MSQPSVGPATHRAARVAVVESMSAAGRDSCCCALGEVKREGVGMAGLVRI